MLVRLLFKDSRCSGYLLYYKEIYPYDEDEIMIETNTEKLEEILGQNWREEFQKLILVDGKIEVDPDWTPEKEEKDNMPEVK